MDAPAYGPTLRDVAKAANVSLATASRVLSGSSHAVSDRSRERVLAAAEALDYRPNRTAQATRAGQSLAVGLVVMDIADPADHTIAAGVISVAAADGLLVTVTASEHRHSIDSGSVSSLLAQRPRALVLAGPLSGDLASRELVSDLSSFAADGGRVVLINQRGLPFDTVEAEQERGARDLVHALADLGYRRFAVLAGPPRSATLGQRLDGYRAGLAARGLTLPHSAIIHSDGTRDGGYAAAGEYLTRHLECEIVLAANDAMALGAMARFREAGLSLPGDLAVAGFDGIPTLREIIPRLTTLQLPLTELGATAMRLALEPAADAPRHVRLAGTPHLDESTPPLA